MMYIGIDKDITDEVMLHNVVFLSDFDKTMMKYLAVGYQKTHQFTFMCQQLEIQV